MCYDGALVMPSSYAVMSEEEMIYVEGGKYVTQTKTLSAANTMYKKLMTASTIGVLSQTVGAYFCPAFAVTSAYFGSVLHNAVSCYNKVQKWLSKYKSSKKCICSVTSWGVFVTNLEVKL